MKLFKLLAVVALTAFSVNAFAQTNVAKKGIKITKITGTVNIIKDGKVIQTLKPGDAIPEITDSKVTFAVVNGTVEVEAGGKTVSAATGSNFSVSSSNGQTNVAVAAGTPVAVKTESGSNVVLTSNSEVKMVNTNGTVAISMEKGTAVMTDASGGQTRTVQAGQTVTVPSASTVTAAATPAPAPVEEAANETNDEAIAPVVVEPPATTVIPTETVLQSEEVSGSNP